MPDNKIKVFKFGGASVRSSDGVRNLVRIVKEYNTNLIIVVSAMGKTTNALELILSNSLSDSGNYKAEVEKLKKFHFDIVNDLFSVKDHILFLQLDNLFNEILWFLDSKPAGGYDYCYDQVISYGEIISTIIVSQYLKYSGVMNTWVDARECIKSDTNYREGNIDFDISGKLCQNTFDFNKGRIFVTQGFIAGTSVGTTTTLGREGSDYTAAIIANLLDAGEVVIWKDVEGVLNADPKIFSNTLKLDFVSFQEAIELAFCGAQIIHPKTIKPLQNKRIPLYVKSFLNPQAAGTKILHSDEPIELPPVLILKRNQVLISLTPRDFSFVIEDCLSKIFALLYKHRVKVNMVHNSAITFSVCVDDEKNYLRPAIEDLQKDFKVKYNSNLELLTVRHYSLKVIEENIKNRQVYLQQRTRSTARFVMDAIERKAPA